MVMSNFLCPNLDRSETLALKDGGQSWSQLARRIETFVDAWRETQSPPSLVEFLPAGDTLRRLTLVELIKIDLEFRYLEYNLPKRIADYLTELPELTAADVPADLLYEEYHLRRQCGLAVDVTEYETQFPEQASALQRFVSLNAPDRSSRLYDRESQQALENLRAGEQLDDFELLRPLGQGSFARVFLARQRSLERLVAVKVSADVGNEPQTFAQLDHDNIVRLYDQRHLPGRGLRVLYMQYLPGGTLQSVIQQVKATPPERRNGRLLAQVLERALAEQGQLPAPSALLEKWKGLAWPKVVCRIGAQLADALDYAHRQGILHRDIKPANVLLSAAGSPKLADFNVSCCSKIVGATPAAYFGGSLGYMSPEQLEASHPYHARQPESLDERSDIYSLGVLLWELLTGERPFRDEQLTGGWINTLEDFLSRRRRGVEPHDFSLPPETPAGLVQVLCKCLAPAPEDRWPSGAELARQLALCSRPRARALLHPEKKSLAARLKAFALPVLFLAGAIPNGLAGVFNYYYNRTEIIADLPERFQMSFWHIQLIINAVAYPLGLGLFLALAYSVIRSIKRIDRGYAHSPKQLPRLWRRCLRLGHYSALIGVGLWLLAGLTYPLSLHLTTGALPATDYPHFLGSLFLCGLIAAVYPFFAVTAFCLHILYPRLLRISLAAPEHEQCLKSLQGIAEKYLALAALVPMLSVLALALMGAEARLVLVLLSTTSLLGFALIFCLYRQIRDDSKALQGAVTEPSSVSA